MGNNKVLFTVILDDETPKFNSAFIQYLCDNNMLNVPTIIPSKNKVKRTSIYVTQECAQKLKERAKLYSVSVNTFILTLVKLYGGHNT